VLPQASGAAVITPDGIGVGESALQALFELAGFSGGASLLSAWRASMMSLCLLGCLFYIAGRKGESSNFTEPLPTVGPSPLN
jgi:uncharacterized membrane protein YbhN (UPF0104 family)